MGAADDKGPGFHNEAFRIWWRPLRLRLVGVFGEEEERRLTRRHVSRYKLSLGTVLD